MPESTTVPSRERSAWRQLLRRCTRDSRGRSARAPAQVRTAGKSDSILKLRGLLYDRQQECAVSVRTSTWKRGHVKCKDGLADLLQSRATFIMKIALRSRWNVIGGRGVPHGHERHALPDRETLHGAPQVARRALAWARGSPCDSPNDDPRVHRSAQAHGTTVQHQ